MFSNSWSLGKNQYEKQLDYLSEISLLLFYGKTS